MLNLEQLLDALFENCDYNNVIKEDVIVTIYIDKLKVLRFSLELLYRVMPYVTNDFGEMCVRRFEQEEKETINIYL